MIGNDVVDLSCAMKESNWKRKGYLDKIYVVSEQSLINSASNSDIMVWLLWSMKEATYKVNQRITGIKEYAPTKIKCSIINIQNDIYLGVVSYNDLVYNTKTIVYKNYIHSVALYNSIDFERIREITINKFPSNYIDYLKVNNYLDASEIIIKDKFGVPNLYNEISKENKPISISHHGEFLILVIINDIKK